MARACKSTIATPLLILVLCLAAPHPSSAARSLSLSSLSLPGIVGVWNPELYPATVFRSDSVKAYFDVWPEDIPDVKFVFYCEDPGNQTRSLSNFTYSVSEGRLDPRPYFDLGVVELYQPYWKHWLFWKVDTKRLTYPINCEYSDLHDLYAFRFWKLTMKNGIAAAAVMQGIIQFIVAVVVTLRWGYQFVTSETKIRKQYLRAWFWNLHWGDFFSEIIHLCLLVCVGYSMMEAIGHSDLTTWRPTVMYNTGVIYTYLSLFAVLSCSFRQIAYAWMEPSKLAVFERLRKQNKLRTEGEIWYSLQGISDDWRWQRVFGQLGVLVLMGTYLSFVDNAQGSGMDQLAGLVLAAAVVACIWSYGVTAVVLFRSVSHILAQVFPAFARFALGRASPLFGSDGEERMDAEVPSLCSCGSHRTPNRSQSDKFH